MGLCGYRHTHSVLKDGLVHVWDVERLWVLADALETRLLPIETISGIDEDSWFSMENPTLRNVAKHAKKILEADLDYPIILNVDGSIMDGAHRVAKALCLGHDKIKTVQFTVTPDADDICSPASLGLEP
ncbi:MAG: hypothetical protein JKY56_26435 [Kofleriaceae bacterium]|nr:hypothetical protein [Kofleriaceae bacterium]